jgi:hypothetical protein
MESVAKWMQRENTALVAAHQEMLVRVKPLDGARAGIAKGDDKKRDITKRMELLKATCLAAGGWDLRCTEILLEMPDVESKLFDWHRNRTVVERAMGDACWLINPFQMGCPFRGCRKLHHDLNGLNRIERMFEGTSGHWVSTASHKTDEASKRLVARFLW